MPQPNFPPFWVLGKVVVTVAGTPVGLLDAFSGGNLKSSVTNLKLRVASILFNISNLLNPNTGYIYIGVKGMVKATGVGVILAIPAAPAGTSNYFTLPSVGWGGGNELSPEDIFMDADTSGNSAQVTLIQY